MKNRSVVSVILLSIFTCGIYSLYWCYVTTEELNAADHDEPLMNYILSILLSLVTCGVYGIYWAYKFYQKADKVTGSNNLILNFILHIFGFSIVSMAITQDEINKSLER